MDEEKINKRFDNVSGYDKFKAMRGKSLETRRMEKKLVRFLQCEYRAAEKYDLPEPQIGAVTLLEEADLFGIDSKYETRSKRLTKIRSLMKGLDHIGSPVRFSEGIDRCSRRLGRLLDPREVPTFTKLLNTPP